MHVDQNVNRRSSWTWHSGWEMPGESLLSCLLKLAWANSATGSEISHCIFGSTLRTSSNIQIHPRSFISTDWTHRFPAKDGPKWVSHLTKEFNSYATLTLTSLYTDRTIRYCSACLTNGVHFPEFQIEALSACPIHDIPLISECHSCGSPTSRYALCEETFASPFFCRHCGFSLIGKINPEKFILNRDIVNLSQSKMRSFQKWVKRVSISGINWIHHDGCLLTELESDPKIQRRIIFCQAAKHALSPPQRVAKYLSQIDSWQVCSAGAEVKERTSSIDQISDDMLNQRIGIYKAIRRYVYRKYIRMHRSCFKSAAGCYVFGSLANSALPDATLCLWAQAWMLWRSRFEEMSTGTDLWGNGQNNRYRTRRYKGGIDDLDITNFECSALILYSFHASFRTLRLWMLSRWDLTRRQIAICDSIEFATVPAPYLQLIFVSQKHLEVQMATVILPSNHSGSPALKFLTGANETQEMNSLRCVCNPYFPRG